ncbi:MULTISPECIES: ABC transporter permease [Thermocrispum]|uniref:Transport permease protein n=1 Tax=Thermocrispum agreste TaxID=37925 RepID=A0A2W4IY29_9PSEU|nr:MULTISPECIES: ABC transporter permease [Thermocrispum]PZM91920.1 MAG: ABC transporter permease [Thermocrispum agreste]
MTALATLTKTEAKLLLRDPAAVFFVIVFPPLLLLVLGAIPPFREPNPETGVRTIDLYVPILVAMAIAMFALSGLPNQLAGYRERGILRRMSTTPVSPAMMLTANLIVFVVTALGVTAVLLALGKLAFDVDLPRQLPGYALVYLLSLVSMLSIGLFIAAVVRTAKAAAAAGQVLFFPILFFAGLWLPRAAMPDTLRQISDYTPLGAGVQALTDTAAGGTPQLLHIVVMLAWIAVTGIAAARLFSWE